MVPDDVRAARHRVVLLRHGETHGYHDDVGLTPRGEEQARERGRALAKEFTTTPPARIRMCHAPTARATATAVTVRDTLVDLLGDEVEASSVDRRFDSLRFCHDGAAVESSAVAARRLALDGPPFPDWAREYDRFDSDYGADSKLGGPIDRWMVATTLSFEPPQIAVYRMWAGIRASVAGAGDGDVTLVATHSGPMRAFVAAAIGHDPGEPANLEPVDVGVHGDHATVAFRDHRVVVEVPSAPPPWIAPGYLEG